MLPISDCHFLIVKKIRRTIFPNKWQKKILGYGLGEAPFHAFTNPNFCSQSLISLPQALKLLLSPSSTFYSMCASFNSRRQSIAILYCYKSITSSTFQLLPKTKHKDKISWIEIQSNRYMPSNLLTIQSVSYLIT